MDKAEIIKLIEEDNCKNYFLINELLAIRDKRKETQDYTIYVDGYISIDVINKTIALENKVKELEKREQKVNKILEKACELYENSEIYDAEEVLNMFLEGLDIY